MAGRVVPAGARCGRLTVLVTRTPGEAQVQCLCDCGTTKALPFSSWGTTQSCGCLHRDVIKARAASQPSRRNQVIPGAQFGRLTVACDRTGGRRSTADCVCECGNKLTADVDALIRGDTRSCGCLQREHRLVAHRTHGQSQSGAYNSWTGMVGRCTNPSDAAFHNYGGRGITVWERWLKFENFYADMGDRPAGHSIERIDNDRGYSPENCKWATVAEQNRNRRPYRRQQICRAGLHNFTPENTKTKADGTRACRACQVSRRRARAAELRLAARRQDAEAVASRLDSGHHHLLDEDVAQ